MGWQKDGSGLDVYRHRGRTVAQRWTSKCSPCTARQRRREPFGVDPCALVRGPMGPKRLRAEAKRARRNPVVRAFRKRMHEILRAVQAYRNWERGARAAMLELAPTVTPPIRTNQSHPTMATVCQ